MTYCLTQYLRSHIDIGMKSWTQNTVKISSQFNPVSSHKLKSKSAAKHTSKSAARHKQIDMFNKEKSAYGGVLRSTRKGRSGARKLTTKYTMHMVLRSSKATGDWSFAKSKNKCRIKALIKKHAGRNYIRIQSIANVGNHLHLHIKLMHRNSYKPFIRAITGAIALIVMGANRMNAIVKSHRDRFWDYRPYTTFVDSFRHYLNMKDYMRINQLEGMGYGRLDARMIMSYEYDVKLSRRNKWSWP